jgi:hypothetical protein
VGQVGNQKTNIYVSQLQYKHGNPGTEIVGFFINFLKILR